MAEKIVAALGGNALQARHADPTAEAQLEIVKRTVRQLAAISGRGTELAVVHGNGPQVGRLLLALETAAETVPPLPVDVCGAMSQGYIGYHIQQALAAELRRQGREVPVVTLATQVVVDRNDPAFQNPDKPIGPFYSRAQASILEKDKGYTMAEDAGRGWRRVVPSPEPRRIVELECVKRLWDHAIVIACGGGGIPVAETADGGLEGVAAVIDKDRSAGLLAEELGADRLLILTEVEKAAIRFGKPNQQDLDHLTVAEAEQYAEAGEFGRGSMLPKIQAAMHFAASAPGRQAVISSLDRALDALDGKTGTCISA